MVLRGGRVLGPASGLDAVADVVRLRELCRTATTFARSLRLMVGGDLVVCDGHLRLGA
jgi:hypothetical protein